MAKVANVRVKCGVTYKILCSDMRKGICKDGNYHR